MEEMKNLPITLNQARNPETATQGKSNWHGQMNHNLLEH